MPRLMSYSERFWPKVDQSAGPDECWPWTGSTNRNGYGWFKADNGRATGAHRVSYELANGPIPVGMHVLHRCDNPPCVNPAHLSLGTNADNVADKISKGRHPGTKQTHCRHGHAFDEANTYIDPRGRRQCRPCNRRAQQLYAARRRSA